MAAGRQMSSAPDPVPDPVPDPGPAPVPRSRHRVRGAGATGKQSVRRGFWTPDVHEAHAPRLKWLLGLSYAHRTHISNDGVPYQLSPFR